MRRTTSTSNAGAKRLTLRSWPFGAPSRRRLLEVVLQSRAPKQGWTKTMLETSCEVAVGALDDHLAALVALGLLEHTNGRFRQTGSVPKLAAALRAVLNHTAEAPDVPPSPLARRTYNRA